MPAPLRAVLPRLLASLLLSTTALASAPLTLPLRDTDGWSLEVPVKAGQRMTVLVPRGLTRLERLDRHAAFTLTQNGKLVSVTVKGGTPAGTTSCFKIHTGRATAYTLCAAVDTSVPTQHYQLK